MGLYVNPNNANFACSMNSPIYVDKSMLIAQINAMVNTDEKHICVSRARRFGKSMAGNMLVAYFSMGCDSRPLFDKLRISQDPSYEKYLNKLNVIQIDVNAFYSEYKGKSDDIVECFTREIRPELKQTFPMVDIEENDSLPYCLRRIYAATGEQFVIIMDEYDVLIREKAPKAMFDSYLRFLNAMFKNATLSPAIALAYLTGILPIVRDKIESKLNLFMEYTMLDSSPLTEFFGFTTDEVKALCQQYDMDFEECKRWYDGYIINSMEIYNPRSVIMAMTDRRCGNYWTRTGSYAPLCDFVQLDIDGIQTDIKTMLCGEKIKFNPYEYLNDGDDFQTKDEALTYLVHIGYLAFDREQQSCYIPNDEIAGEWLIPIRRTTRYKSAYDLIEASRQLLQSTLDGDCAAVAQALNSAHEEICSPLSYNNEGTFQAIIRLAYFYAKSQYTIIRELPTGKGYADLVLIPYVPGIPAVIIELKRNQCTETALAQIRAKRYFASLEHYQGSLLFVGINYDETTKEHTCAIEQFVK